MNHPIPNEPPDDEFFFYNELRPPFPPMPGEEIPRNKEAERAVISAMLQWPRESIPEVEFHGGIALFSVSSHRTIYETLVALPPGTINLLTVADVLCSRNFLDSVGGHVALANLFCEVPCMKNLPSWLELLRKVQVRRELFEASTATRQAACKGGRDAHDLLDEAEARLKKIRSILEKPNSMAIKNTMLTVIEKMERSINGSTTTGLATGFSRLDALTNGFRPGELVVIGGLPGVGKSTLALNLVEFIAMNSDAPAGVGWVALQEPSEQTVEKLIVSRAGLNLHDLRAGRLSQRSHLQKITSAASEVAETNIHIDDRQMSILHLGHRARRWKEEFNIQCLVVDYLQLLTGDSNRGSSCYEMELAELSSGLKCIAHELRIPVIAIAASFTNSVSVLDERQPGFGLLGDLWPILQDADLVACLWDRKDSSPSGKTFRELHLLKQRTGPPGKVVFEFIPEQMRLIESDSETDPAFESSETETDEFPASTGESFVVSEKGIFPS